MLASAHAAGGCFLHEGPFMNYGSVPISAGCIGFWVTGFRVMVQVMSCFNQVDAPLQHNKTLH